MWLPALVLAALSTVLPAAFVPPPILMYHRVDPVRPADALGRSLTVTPQQLGAQLAALRRNGVAVISVHQLYLRLCRGRPLDRVVVATFDDGYAGQAAYAVPLLRRFHASATFYIVTGTVGRRGHVTWSDLTAMTRDGMDIAAHGVEHDDLSAMSAARQRYQIDTSIRLLRDRLRVPVDSYAYPSGRLNRTTLLLVREAGMALALTTDRTYVIAPQTALQLTRVRVRGEWTLQQFEQAVEAARRNGIAVVAAPAKASR